MRLSISGQQLASAYNLQQIVEVLRSFDVDAIDLWPENLPGGNSALEQGRYEQKDIISAHDLLKDAGISVACVTLSSDVLKQSGMEGATYGTQALRGAVDAAVVLEAPLVNCYLAGLAPALFSVMMRPATEYAGSRGVTIVLENEAHDDSGTSSGMRAIMNLVGSAFFGTTYDPCNYYQANEEPYPAAYEAVKDFIRYVHLKGGCPYDLEKYPTAYRGGRLRGSSDQRIGYISLPESVIDTGKVLARLVQDGYSGFITLEPHVPVEKVIDYYRNEVPYVRSLLTTYTKT